MFCIRLKPSIANFEYIADLCFNVTVVDPTQYCALTSLQCCGARLDTAHEAPKTEVLTVRQHLGSLSCSAYQSALEVSIL